MSYELDPIRGVQVHYGQRTTTGKYGKEVPTEGLKRQVVYVFDYSDLPTNGATNMEFSIPAYSKIVGARFEVLTAFAGGTSYAVGLNDKAGNVIAATGLFTGTELALANINARGKFVTGAAGTLMNASIGATAGEVVVAATGTFTGGKARLIVEYIQEGPKAA